MALTITSAGNGSDVANSTTLVISSVTASVGDVLLLCIASENYRGSGASAIVNSIADNAGGSTNVYSQRGTTGNQTAGSPGDGASQLFYECPVTTALSGATITISFSSNTRNKAAEIYRIQPGAGEAVVYVGVGTASAGANQTTHGAATVSVENGQTIFAMSAIETDDAVTGDSDTTNGSWSTVLTRLASGGTDAGSMTCSSQYKTVNATGNQSWACTTASGRDSVANTIIYGVPKSISAGGGSYTISGTAATPKLGRKTAAAAGSYALTGTAAATKHGWKVVADAGSYAITGTAATLTYTPSGSTYTLAAGSGAYAITGTAGSPLLKRRATAAAGSYAITGTAATPKLGRRTVAGAGSYLLTGTAASLLHTYKIAALAGSYAIDGTAAATLKGWRITAEGGAYVITGSSATLTYAQIVIENVLPGQERCMRCGFVKNRSETRREWTGLIVCRSTCWDPRHPQMSLRGVPDRQNVPWTSPEPTPLFIEPSSISGDDL